ncbi:quinol oxidase subunit 3 [mine drainage metagenome]|uniref:Quinol oxidase subunit 3 n=1 Tax=mine drainage metagenome TaxID=410659 RepID=A0A1J5RSD3_9ZZZZ
MDASTNTPDSVMLTEAQQNPNIKSEKGQGDLPGDLALWIFIFAEMLVFGVLFVAYAFTRANNVALFNDSQLTLSQTSGAINTLVLITSSYFVVRGVSAIKRGLSKQCAHWLTGALLLGGVFISIKLVEFYAKFAADITMSTNTFYMFYLSLTFFHFMHVLMGMVILGSIIAKAHRGGYSAQEHAGVETGASFWHMVDFLWIILFPLVYIIR